MKFQIDKAERAYLGVQAGGISPLLSEPDKWHKEYELHIEYTYRSILSWLPDAPGSLLDVAGGLSGMGARLNAHYGKLAVSVLDGDAPPVVKSHDVPFNSRFITQRFLERNGVTETYYFTPEQEFYGRMFGLITSFQGWCFHFEPRRYLDKVKAALLPSAVAIVDVRKHKLNWYRQLTATFGPGDTVLEANKWERVVFPHAGRA